MTVLKKNVLSVNIRHIWNIFRELYVIICMELLEYII